MYFKWSWKTSPFDIKTVVFHFDDFNNGRQVATIFFNYYNFSSDVWRSKRCIIINVVSQPTIQWKSKKYHIVGTKIQLIYCRKRQIRYPEHTYTWPLFFPDFAQVRKLVYSYISRALENTVYVCLHRVLCKCPAVDFWEIQSYCTGAILSINRQHQNH